MEESLLLALGPPADERLKELFDEYQSARKSGETHHDSDWESYEKMIVEKLFEHTEEAQSTIDELLGKLLDSPIKITDYFFSMGRHRGLWVANITISPSNVLRGKSSSIAWPPPKDVNDVVAASLGYMLERNWIGVFSLQP